MERRRRVSSSIKRAARVLMIFPRNKLFHPIPELDSLPAILIGWLEGGEPIRVLEIYRERKRSLVRARRGIGHRGYRIESSIVDAQLT